MRIIKEYRQPVEKRFSQWIIKHTCPVIFALSLLILIAGIFCVVHSALSETLTVTISSGHLNARANPGTNSEITMRLYDGDTVEALSTKDGWVEIEGGETGTSWCKAEYLSSSQSASQTYVNTSGGRVRIRDEIEGNPIGWVASGETVSVSRSILGWGYIGKGWVDLSYFQQESLFI